MNENDIKVSILCITYNHEKYIRDALEGFINQKTSFNYEILIHDDASSDNTQKILHEYEKKYKNLISVVYQKENQYSRGINIEAIYQVPRAKGKYIALCEGDDYWIDENKLQKQYDAMEKHPEVDICAHGFKQMFCGTNKNEDILLYQEETIIPVEKVILGGGGYVATNSLFYRKSIHDNEPDFRKISGIDYTLQVLGAIRGGMLYLPCVMSVYRYMADGSWTKAMMNNKERKLALNQMWIRILTQMDLDTNHDYQSEFGMRLLLSCITPFETISNNMKLIRKYKNSFLQLKISQRVIILSKIYGSGIYKIRYMLNSKKYQG